jgi:hypothetical protein
MRNFAIVSFLFVGCSNPMKFESIKCAVDSVYLKPIITVQDQITPTWIHHTNCGNVFSLYNTTHKVGDTIVFLSQIK